MTKCVSLLLLLLGVRGAVAAVLLGSWQIVFPSLQLVLAFGLLLGLFG